MSPRFLTPGMLMDFSESRLYVLRCSGTSDERRVITRLLDQPSGYSRWGAFHYSFMQKVAGQRNRHEQLARLRQTTFTLFHRQALFEYLRDNEVTDRNRETLFSSFHGHADYRHAVIAEHRRFLESNSSLYCADHLELRLMHDRVFTAGFAVYRQQYMEYFSLHCDWVLAEHSGFDYPLQEILLDMKRRLARSAAQLMALPEYRAPREAIRTVLAVGRAGCERS